jgi:hypothetical protein
MPSQVSCPSCGLTLRIKDELIGKRVKCPQCAVAFAAEEDTPRTTEETVSRSRSPAPPATDDGKPLKVVAHRGTMVLTLGICSLAGIVIWPLAWAGTACGICAWVFGHKDLQRMAKGEMDKEGEGPSRAGMICGMIAAIVEGLMTVVLIAGFILALFGVIGTATLGGATCCGSCCCGLGGTTTGGGGGR